jgi:hypothetical protein
MFDLVFAPTIEFVSRKLFTSKIQMGQNLDFRRYSRSSSSLANVTANHRRLLHPPRYIAWPSVTHRQLLRFQPLRRERLHRYGETHYVRDATRIEIFVASNPFPPVIMRGVERELAGVDMRW